MITPLDIENKRFSKQKLGGYNVDEVDDFLDELTLEYGKLYTVNRSMKLWGLTKNIILDGSGTLNYAYKLQKEKIKFKISVVSAGGDFVLLREGLLWKKMLF